MKGRKNAVSALTHSRTDLVHLTRVFRLDSSYASQLCVLGNIGEICTRRQSGRYTRVHMGISTYPAQSGAG